MLRAKPNAKEDTKIAAAQRIITARLSLNEINIKNPPPIQFMERGFEI
jgi:hypothetical protein